MLPVFVIWILLFGTVTAQDDDEYYEDENGSSIYDDIDDDDLFGTVETKFEFKDSNENKTVNKVHKHHDALVALFGSEDKVMSSVYGRLHKPTHLSFAEVKINIRKALADQVKSSSLSKNQTAEINEVIKKLDDKMLESSETHPEAWFMQTITEQWDNLAAVLPAKSVASYLSHLAASGDNKVWDCEDGHLVSLWRDVANAYQDSCDSGVSGCSEEDLKNAVFSIAKISMALKNKIYQVGTIHDFEDSSNKAEILFMLSQKRNRAFATKTLGSVQELEDLVQSIICEELKLSVLENVLEKFSKQPSYSGELSPSFVNTGPVLSDIDDLLTLFEIQATLAKVTTDVATAAANENRNPNLPFLGRNMLNSYMELIDTAVDVNSTDVWAQMSLEDVNEKLHHMLLSNERYVGSMSDIILINAKSGDEPYTLDKDSLSVTMLGMKLENNTSNVAKFEFDDTHIWTDDMNEFDDAAGDDVKVYSLRYKSWSHMIEEILVKHQNLSINNDSYDAAKIDATVHSRRVRSIVDAASEITSNKSFVGKGGIVSLSTRKNGIKKSIPVTYRIEFDENFLSNVSQLPRDSSFYHCLSCEYLAEETITWESHGCHVVSVNDSGVTCKCNHTTNFAAFMMPAEMAFEITEEEEGILTILSIIGSILSIVGLIFSLIIFYLVRNLVRNERLKAHTNLAVALLVVHILYLPGDFYLRNDSMCVATTVLLHYFLLATFMWMLIEGIFLYLYVVQVFLRSKIASYNWMYVVGWIVPVGIVALSAGIGIPNNAYVPLAPPKTISENLAVCPAGTFKFPRGDVNITNANDDYTYARCWLSTDGMIWSFLAPAVLVLAFNAVIMCKTLQVCVKSLNASSQVRSQNKICKKSGKSSPPTSHSASTGHSTGHYSTDSYDHSNGETKRLYTKNTKIHHPVSASPCLLQVTTDDEEKCKKETIDTQSKDSSTFTDDNNTSHKNNDASLKVEDKEKGDISARYHSVSGDSTRYTNSRPSFVYRNSVSHNSPRQVARSPSMGDKMPQLSASDKTHFFKDARAAVKGAVVLLPILGIPWLFGLFAHLSPVLTILFIFLNATQGVAIFIVYCVFNGEVRRAIHRRLAKIRTRHQVDSSVRRSSSTSTSRSFLRFGRRRSTVTTSA